MSLPQNDPALVEIVPRWLSVQMAAAYCSLSEKSIRNLIAAGRITPSRAVRGRCLIDRLQLDAVLISECGARPRKGRGIRKATRSPACDRETKS